LCNKGGLQSKLTHTFSLFRLNNIICLCTPELLLLISTNSGVEFYNQSIKHVIVFVVKFIIA